MTGENSLLSEGVMELFDHRGFLAPKKDLDTVEGYCLLGSETNLCDAVV